MKQAILTPGVSLGYIYFDGPIDIYEHRNHEYDELVGDLLYSCYSFSDLDVLAYVTSGKIEFVRCVTECIWQEINLIGLKYEDFKKIYNAIPNDTDHLCVSSYGMNQIQDVYDYDALGLQLWAQNDEIVTVIANDGGAD